MQTVTLKPLFHRGQDSIGIYFSRNNFLQSLIQGKTDAKWSRTHACWYLPLSEKNYQQLAKALDNIAILQIDELKNYLLEKKKYKRLLSSQDTGETKTEAKKLSAKDASHTQPSYLIHRLSEENTEALVKFKQLLVLKSYSPSTIRTYTNEFVQFLNVLNDKPANGFSVERMKDYLQYCHTELKLSEATLHSRMNALKFYFEQVLKKENFFWEIPRPKKPLQLPKVISKEQIASLINAIENTKHKTIIMLAYACGLRVSEVVSLKVKQVDGQRKILFVERAKGKKDRIVSLSPGMLIMLREYYKKYKPTDYLFEGQFENAHLTTRSIQNVLQKAKEKAGIKQDGSMHMLRHSFATHLLDKGIDVVFIQKLLGHNDIKTTLKYLHVTNKDLVHILSPLEDIEGLLKK